MRIRHVFRRSVNKDDCVDHPYPGVLFGQPLSKVTDGELPPPPVMVRVSFKIMMIPHNDVLNV